ncbi:MAG: TlpA family protein disulfide reductase [Candidatus Brocadia sp.]|jgi:Thiol-disulfide isomerase and thioredoxins|uniref:Thiol-disulfide oxidoreductase n=1 Tax=Candidatus Brocadia fulgida TaxID=380242 RepID=A0A0M2UWS8_9BACT|nr:MAG: thiol-disulfide oxidoreductase [Candidatus Brocadia fulgida]MBV6518046.1 Thiol-disulfide oxidoreductase ResA [Candidatus Brocadia fulgida]OQZ01569.1 MAG: thiol-disulfide oxidoreductase [Candidatus Brocadia sp. UTAMX2]UJS22265.1 MAG: TlpA family protein disulfide reductase [Candidatus Brocadia sp.]
MNKKIGKYFVLISVFSAMIFFITSAISHAGDSVNKIKLADLNALIEGNKGKVVIVDLWATWCPPCRKEIPGFINLYNKHRSKGVEIIGIAFDENGVEVVPPAVKKMGINYPVYLGGGDIAEAHDLQAYPTTLVYGKDGKIASRHVGFVSEKEFDDEIGMLLKK